METSPYLPSQPSSPGVGPIPLKDCVEELLKFTLLSCTKGKLHVGLSNEYCAKLLEEDTYSLVPYNNEASQGIPSYPLYKRLASSLCQSIYFGSICTEPTDNELISVNEGLFVKKDEDKSSELIVTNVHALWSMLNEVHFELHVQEPFFSQLKDGLKTVEGRCAVGEYKRIKSGDILLFNKCLILQVQVVRQYASFHEMLEVESLTKVLPGVRSIEEGVQIYRKFYSEEKESSNGVLAICVNTPTSQLYDIMASLLSGLSHGGVQKLLGFAHTTGTNLELLPPATSTLLATFMAPHNPDDQP